MKKQRFIFAWSAFLLFLVGCQVHHPSDKGNPTVEVSPSGDQITILADDIPLATLLSELARRGIDVQLSEPANPKVTVKIKGASLEDALEKLLPKDSRYILRLGDREVASTRPFPEGRKKEGDKAPPRKDLPTKDAPGTRLPTRVGLTAKPASDAPRNEYTRSDSGKPEVEAVSEVARGENPKRARVAAGEGKQSVHLSFAISRTGGITLQSAAVIDGERPESTAVRGPLLVIAKNRAGSIVAMETLTDPLEEHSYREDGTHIVMEAEEGWFGVTLPIQLTGPEALAGVTFHFYDLRTVGMPARIDRESIPNLIGRAKQLGQVEGENAAGKLSDTRQPQAK